MAIATAAACSPPVPPLRLGPELISEAVASTRSEASETAPDDERKPSCRPAGVSAIAEAATPAASSCGLGGGAGAARRRRASCSMSSHLSPAACDCSASARLRGARGWRSSVAAACCAVSGGPLQSSNSSWAVASCHTSRIEGWHCGPNVGNLLLRQARKTFILLNHSCAAV